VASPKAPIKICLACSHGGHLTEMLELAEAFAGHDTFYFCYDADTTRQLPNVHLVPNMARNPIEFLKNLFRVWRLFRRERPGLVVSTGAEIAIPVVLVAKLMRVPVVYIECGAQVTHPSFTGRIMYWLADTFFVQWPELLDAYGPRAVFRGSLIDEDPPPNGKRPGGSPAGASCGDAACQTREKAVIYVTVGTMFLDFPRLIRKMDEIAGKTGELVCIQTGLGRTYPKNCEHFDFKSREEVLALQRDARVIVCHAGIGSVMDALRARRPLIVVPRLKKFNEHMNDHQLDVAKAVQTRGWGRLVLDIDDLDEACAMPPPVPENYKPARDRLIGAVRECVERVAAGLR